MKSHRITRSLFAAVHNWIERNTLHDVGTDLNQVANAGRKYQHAPDMPTVVTLCGSTQFKAEFEAVQRLETQNGRIVLSVGMYTHADGWAVTEGMKKELDDLHKRKIDISDEIIVVNVGGYVGESTRSEIEYAIANAVMVRWLNVDKVPAPWGEYVCPHRTAYLAKFSKESGGTAPDFVHPEQPTDRTDLPPIVPEMIPSPNAQVESPEPDMETVDAMERAGRLALVEETRKAWVGREVTTGTEFTIAQATVDLQTGHSVSTSGFISTRPMLIEDQARDEFLAAAAAKPEDQVTRDARQAYENRYHKIAAEVGIQAWTTAYRRMVESGVQECSGKEIEALAKQYGAEDSRLCS